MQRIGGPPRLRCEARALCPAERLHSFLLRFGYPGGPAVEVYVNISGCTTFAARNGDRSTAIDTALEDFLVDAAGYDSGFPGLQ